MPKLIKLIASLLIPTIPETLLFGKPQHLAVRHCVLNFSCMLSPNKLSIILPPRAAINKSKKHC